MLFTIVEDFSKESGEAWDSYIKWRGLNFDHFHSLDGILRPDLFTPETDEDWDNISCEYSKMSYITNLEYARKKRTAIGFGTIVGLTFDEHNEEEKGFLGYDIIDGYCSVSLLTNWGTDISFINQSLSHRALVDSYTVAYKIHQLLLEGFSSDPHVEGCKIISIYRTT